MTDILSFRDTVQLLQEFLETSFHLILYIRQVYPPELFHQRKVYDTVPVWQCRNPALNEYVGRITEAVGEELAKGSLSKVALVIKEASLEEKPLERFVFDFSWLIPESALPAAGKDWTPSANGLLRSQVQDHLKSFLLKINAADAYLPPLPPEATFTVIIELKDDAPPPESTAASRGDVPCEWVPSEERHAPGGRDEGQEDRWTVAPMKSTRLGMINVQLLVEQLIDGNSEDGRSGAGEKQAQKVDRKGKGRMV